MGIISVVGLGLIWGRMRANAAEADLVSRLVSTVYDKLKSQAKAYDQDIPRPRYLTSLHLRDELLRNEHSVRTRARVWQRVEYAIESNTNIRVSLEETAEGEEMHAWTWIGIL